jgi:4-amino-4-deoxy-L-arabinose transferase-like glycosyltransferase
MLVPTLQFYGTAFAGTLLMIAFAFVVGRSGVHLLRMSFDSLLEEAACSIAAGLGVIALIVFLFGISHVLVGQVLAPAMVLLGISALVHLRRVHRPPGNPMKAVPSGLLFALVISIALFPLLLLPLYPPTASDAVTYHLAVAQHYLQTGSVQPTPQYRYAVFPQLVEMLFTVSLMLGNDVIAQCVSFVFLLVTAAAVVAFVRRQGHGASSSWGAALLVSNSAVLVLAGAALCDLALTAYVTLSVLAFERWREEKQASWLVFSGLMGGCAAGTKYSALFFPLVLGMLTFVGADNRRRTRSLLTLAVPCILAAMPWYLYNAWHTGNPVWPFFSGLFGHEYWSDADVRGQTADLLTNHGTGTGLRSLLLLPWNLFMRPGYFHAEGEFSVPVLIGIPFALYETARRGYARRIALVGLSFGLFWFMTAQILRYLLPALPLLCVLASAGMSHLFGRMVPGRGSVRMLAVIVVAGLLVLPGWRFARRQVASLGPPPVTLEARDVFLERRIPSYGAIRYLERSAGSSATLYSYGEPRVAYFTRGEFRGDYFGPWRYDRLTGLLGGKEEDLLRELNAMGIGYLLVRDDPGGSECRPSWLERRHVVPVFRTPGVILFAVRGSSHGPVFGPETGSSGSGLTDSATAGGARFECKAGEMYYGWCAGNARTAATVVFQMAWFAGDGRTIRTDETSGVFTPGNDTLRVLSTAPPGSSTALISCSPIGEAAVSVRSLGVRAIHFSPAVH